MLPPVRPSRSHAHDVDPYESPAGAVPIRLRSETTEPIKRKMTKEDIAARDLSRKEAKMRAARYDRYLDAMIEFGGDREQAIADVYGLPVEEARLRMTDLHADVVAGIGTSSLADVLERNDLAMAARGALLRRHAYSANPAASLKAIDMVTNLEGERGIVTGTFEDFLRTVKAQKGA